MSLIVNGQTKQLPSPAILAQLIKDICADDRHVIIEHNGQIVRRPDWNSTTVKPGDTIELVTLVGGG